MSELNIVMGYSFCCRHPYF